MEHFLPFLKSENFRNLAKVPPQFSCRDIHPPCHGRELSDPRPHQPLTTRKSIPPSHDRRPRSTQSEPAILEVSTSSASDNEDVLRGRQSWRRARCRRRSHDGRWGTRHLEGMQEDVGEKKGAELVFQNRVWVRRRWHAVQNAFWGFWRSENSKSSLQIPKIPDSEASVQWMLQNLVDDSGKNSYLLN